MAGGKRNNGGCRAFYQRRPRTASSICSIEVRAGERGGNPCRAPVVCFGSPADGSRPVRRRADDLSGIAIRFPLSKRPSAANTAALRHRKRPALNHGRNGASLSRVPPTADAGPNGVRGREDGICNPPAAALSKAGLSQTGSHPRPPSPTPHHPTHTSIYILYSSRLDTLQL